jgi:gluconate 2-dehydrogenase gamma chain
VVVQQAPAEVVVERLVEREGLEFFNTNQAATVDAIAARLIPTDANGPGATEARVGVYIDRALNGPLSFFQSTYQMGLEQVDEYSQATYGAPFATLSAAQQDATLAKFQAGTAAGVTPDGGKAFFALVLQHSLQGMFGDPFWGGNANFVGWDLIGYPGVKIADIHPSEQMLDTPLKPVHKSGYSYSMFQKTTKLETAVHALDQAAHTTAKNADKKGSA